MSHQCISVILGSRWLSSILTTICTQLIFLLVRNLKRVSCKVISRNYISGTNVAVLRRIILVLLIPLSNEPRDPSETQQQRVLSSPRRPSPQQYNSLKVSSLTVAASRFVTSRGQHLVTNSPRLPRPQQ